MEFRCKRLRYRIPVSQLWCHGPKGSNSSYLDSDRVRHEAITELYLRGLSPGHVLRAKGGMCSTRPLLATGPRSRGPAGKRLGLVSVSSVNLGPKSR